MTLLLALLALVLIAAVLDASVVYQRWHLDMKRRVVLLDPRPTAKVAGVGPVTARLILRAFYGIRNGVAK